jgi:sugar phosphate isomerase/epimerase
LQGEKMKVGISTWSLLGLDIGAAVKAIGDSGADYIELWGEVPHAYPGWSDRREVEDALSAYNMTVTAHAPFTDLNPANPFQPVKEAVAKTLESFVEFCASLGVRIITVHPGSVHNEAMVQRSEDDAVSTLTRMVKVAGGRLGINVENQAGSSSVYCYPLGSTTESLASLINRVPGCGCTLDSGHAHASGQDPSAMAKAMGAKLTEIHLSDNSGDLDDHLIPGRGTAPLARLMEQVAGRDILVCLELNPHMYTPEQALGAFPTIRQAYT